MGNQQQKVNRRPFENLNRLGVSIAQKVLPNKMKEDEFESFLTHLTKKCETWSWCAPVQRYFEQNRKKLYGKYCDHLKTNCLTVGLANSTFDLAELNSIFTDHFKQQVKSIENSQKGMDRQAFTRLLEQAKAFLALTWYIQESVKQLGNKENENFRESAASADIPTTFDSIQISDECFQIFIQLATRILKSTITELEKAIKEKQFLKPDIQVLEDYKKSFKYLYEFRRPTVTVQQKQKYLARIYENIPGQHPQVVSALIQRFGAADYYCDLYVLSELGCQNAWAFRIELQKPLLTTD